MIEGTTFYVFRPTPWRRLTEIPCELVKLSTLNDERCGHVSDEPWRMLITGTGRSGTLGTTICLNNSGENTFNQTTIVIKV